MSGECFILVSNEFSKKVDLKVINGNTVKKTKAYNDIDLNNWKEYDHIETGTLWMFPSRAKGAGHKFDYHGNYIPQIAMQLYSRFTKPDDIILDLFLGSGTSAIEAINLNRKCIGVEIKQDLAEYVKEKIPSEKRKGKIEIICGDSSSHDIKSKHRYVSF